MLFPVPVAIKFAKLMQTGWHEACLVSKGIVQAQNVEAGIDGLQAGSGASR